MERYGKRSMGGDAKPIMRCSYAAWRACAVMLSTLGYGHPLRGKKSCCRGSFGDHDRKNFVEARARPWSGVVSCGYNGNGWLSRASTSLSLRLVPSVNSVANTSR
jgi:hypothetical protein